MYQYKILGHDCDHDGKPNDRITDGEASWTDLRTALLKLGADGWEVVYAWRNDYKNKSITPVGIREDVCTERELLLKRQTTPARSFIDRILRR